MKKAYILVFLTPIFVFLILESALAEPRFFWYLSAAAIILASGSISLFAKVGRSTSKQWNFHILPISFLGSLVLYSSLIPSKAFIHVLFIIAAAFLWNYLKISYNLLALSRTKQRYMLENISSYGNLLTFFLISASLYALKPFLGVSIWILAACLLAAVLVVLYQNMWVYGFAPKKRLIFIPLITLLIMEMAVAVYFLPFNHNAIGLILTICYYIFIGLSRIFIRKTINRRNVKLYLVFGFLSIIIVLFTSKWS